MTEIPDYGFAPFLEARSADWFDDDRLLHQLLDRHAPDADRARLARFGPRAAGRLRTLAEASARPENAPALRHRDPYDHRLDEIVLPATTHEALHIAHGEEGLGAVRGDPFVHYAMIYLLAQNGEAGVACSLACTDGLVRALEAFHGDDPSAEDPYRAALRGVLESSGEGYIHGAQFVTEIQGGSDVPANRVRAVPDDDAYRIHGQKWFCSNINADWFLVTARPESGGGQGPAAGADPGDAEGDEAGDEAAVGLFLVPAFVGGHRNGYTVDRLKDKLGTRELATAEVSFDGARAWPVGPLDRGIPNLLRYVLTPSRFACVLFAASALRRAERIIEEYAGFREAFGRPIDRYPLVRRTLDDVAGARRQALIVTFELLRLWRAAEEEGDRGAAALDFRILLSLAKPVLTRLATEQLHEAMMVLAGNGIEERFSPLPRLFRDSVIMETWEGPHNVLITQALRDLGRYEVDPNGFLERVAGAPHGDLAAALKAALAAPDRSAGDGEGTGGRAGGGGMGASGTTGVLDPTVALAELAPEIIGAVAAGRDPGRA